MFLRYILRDEAGEGGGGGGGGPDPGAELAAAKAELEAAKQREAEAAPFVEEGRKIHRERVTKEIIGGATIARGGEVAFSALVEMTARSLGVNLDKPSHDDLNNMRKELAKIAGPLLQSKPIGSGAADMVSAPSKPRL